MLGPQDADGRLELQERFEHLRRVAMKESAPRMRLVDQLHKFPNIYKEFLNKYTRQQLEGLEKCFLGADHDYDGRLNSMELKYWLEKHNRPVSRKELEKILEIADEDKDGALNFREFLHFCDKIQLQDVSSSEGKETFYDCLTIDENSHNKHHHAKHSSRSKNRKSLEDLQSSPQVMENVNFFEARVLEEEQKATFEEKRAKEYEKRVQTIKKESGFDLHEFCKDIHHPNSEEVKRCGSSGHQKTGDKDIQETKRYRTKIYITPTSVIDDSEDALIIIPVTPSSSHKFDADADLQSGTAANEAVHGQDWSAVSVRDEIRQDETVMEDEITSSGSEEQRKRQSLEAYERSYGSMPQTDIVAAEIVREAIETGQNLGEERHHAYGNMQEDFESLDVATPTPESALWSLLNK